MYVHFYSCAQLTESSDFKADTEDLCEPRSCEPGILKMSQHEASASKREAATMECAPLDRYMACEINLAL